MDFFYITHRKAAPKEGAAEDEVLDGVRFFRSRWKFWIRLRKVTSHCSQTTVSSEEVVGRERRDEVFILKIFGHRGTKHIDLTDIFLFSL